MDLAARIAYYRKLAGLSQTALATACGWASPSRVGNYEKGTREPNLADLQKIADAVGVAVTVLTYGEDSPSCGLDAMGLRLKQAREHAGLTQGQLADAVGMTQTSISDLERGKSRATSFTARIAEVCGVSALWLEQGGRQTSHMANKKPLPPDRLAECKAANDIFIAKKNQLGLTQRKIAEVAGIAPSSVAFYLSGKNPLNLKFALILSNLLQVPVESFSPRLAAEIAQVAAASDSNATRFPGTARIAREYPLISWEDADCARESSTHYTEGGAEAWLPSTEQAGQLGYWLKVRGDSMTSNTPPSFPEGTPILVQPEGWDLLSGKFYIARHREGHATFKKYAQDAGVGYLVPLNPT